MVFCKSSENYHTCVFVWAVSSRKENEVDASIMTGSSESILL